MMRIYKDLNMVEQLGSGVPRILEFFNEECFHISDNFLRMTFPASAQVTPQVRKEFGKEISRAYEIICEHPEYTAEQIGEAISKTSRTVKTYISKLKEAGFIGRKGAKLGGHWEIIDKR